MKKSCYLLPLAWLLSLTLTGCDNSQESQQLREMMKHPLQEAQKAVDLTEAKAQEQHKMIEKL